MAWNSSGVPLSEFPEAVQKRIRAAMELDGCPRNRDNGPCARAGNNPVDVWTGAVPLKRAPSSRARGDAIRLPRAATPNKGEADYNRTVLHGLGTYEPLTMRLPGGVRYTPDFATFDATTGRMTLHEVKGGYRLGSHGRARAAFLAASAAFPQVVFIWAYPLGYGAWKQQTVIGGVGVGANGGER